MNKPVAWMYRVNNSFNTFSTIEPPDDAYDEGTLVPLYTQDQLEEARKLGMQQERALWNLSESTQELESFDRTASHMAGEYVAHKELNDGGEPVKNATYWKRRHDNLLMKLNTCAIKVSELEKKSHPVKELTDEEINKLWAESHEDGIAMQQVFTTQQHYFATLILRKASE